MTDLSKEARSPESVTKRIMICPYCGYRREDSGIGAVYCGPHKNESGGYSPAIRMREQEVG